MDEDIQREVGIERIRVDKATRRFDPPLSPQYWSAAHDTTKYAERPHPIDYGLTYEETFHGLYLADGTFRDELPEDGFSGFKYKQGDWVNFYSGWAVAIWFPLYLIGFFIVTALNPNIPGGGWTFDNPRAIGCFFLAMAFPGFVPGFLIVAGIVQAVRESRRKRHPSANLLAFLHALHEHKAYLARLRAEAIAEQELLRRKRSYWERLNGYQFETETAEILKKHQFDARVTRGSADGGVDIEVTRNGLKGVVQCKAHVACVGPHVVRDLYGAIHHSGAAFGIIVSRGGFTQGAVDFKRGKPILFVDVADLIAMQEGRDVLAGAFTRTNAPETR